VLDVEQQLFAAADRRRQRAGITSPIDSGPLSQKLEAPSPAPTAEQPAAVAATSATAKIGAAAKGADARAVGKALYRAGRFDDALKAWELVRLDDPATPLELHYMRADAQFRSGHPEEAIKGWEKLAADHADTSFGQQADFALKIARAMVALKGAHEDAAAAKSDKAAPDPKADPKADAKDGKTGDKKGEGHSP
jgi:tetratricopeptide (TPR) repeat protein